MTRDPRNQEKSNPPDEDSSGPNKGPGEYDRVRGLLYGCHHPITCNSEVLGFTEQVAGRESLSNTREAHDGIEGPESPEAAPRGALEDIRDHSK